MLDWPSGVSVGQQNPSFSHRDGTDSNLTTQAGKQPLGMKTHTPGLEKRREAETGKRKEMESQEGEEPSPFLKVASPHLTGGGRTGERAGTLPASAAQRADSAFSPRKGKAE